MLYDPIQAITMLLLCVGCAVLTVGAALSIHDVYTAARLAYARLRRRRQLEAILAAGRHYHMDRQSLSPRESSTTRMEADSSGPTASSSEQCTQGPRRPGRALEAQ